MSVSSCNHFWNACLLSPVFAVQTDNDSPAVGGTSSNLFCSLRIIIFLSNTGLKLFTFEPWRNWLIHHVFVTTKFMHCHKLQAQETNSYS